MVCMVSSALVGIQACFQNTLIALSVVTRAISASGTPRASATFAATAAIAELVPSQRAVIELRDVQGLTSVEVCELLDITEANQRVLLHRARARVRQLLEDYLT